MSHARQQIRDRVLALLTGTATAGANVSDSRSQPHAAAALPSLAVYTLEEEIESRTVGARTLTRHLTVQVQGRAKAVTGVDNALDNLAADTEAALLADPTLGIGCKEVMLLRSVIDLAGEGDKPAGLITLTFAVLYRTAASNPTAIIA